MRRSERDEWVADLRSEQFPQFTGGMLRADGPGTESGQDEFCCLGVKLERDARTGRHGIVRVDHGYAMAGDTDWVDALPSPAMLGAWGLPEGQARHLAAMNDGEVPCEREGSYSFGEIADWIEANVAVEDD